MVFTNFFTVHLRTLLAVMAIPIFVAAWWWFSFVPLWPVLAPTEVVAGKRVIIDPGHGGVDPGAVGLSGTLEKDVVLEIATHLMPLFDRVAVYTTMIREGDVDLSDGDGSLRQQKRTDLSRRVQIANESKADIYLSLHANSFPSSRWSGAQTFYYPGKEEDQSLAVAIQSELTRAVPGNTRQARPGEYYVLQQSQMPAVVVEVGFLSNPEEEELLTDPGYQQKLAAAIFRGVVRYLVEQGTREMRSDASTPTKGQIGSEDQGERVWLTERAPFSNREFLVYFDSPTNESDGLAASIMLFPEGVATGPLLDRLRYAVEALVDGPPEGSVLLPTVPTGTHVRGVTVRDGTVHVDFSQEVYLRFWGGGRSEELLIESVVRTLGQFEGVDEVVIEVEGRSEGTSLAMSISADRFRSKESRGLNARLANGLERISLTPNN